MNERVDLKINRMRKLSTDSAEKVMSCICESPPKEWQSVTSFH